MNYVDIIILIIIVLLGVLGAKRGFVKSVIGILSLAASVALAWMLYPVIAEILESVGVKKAIYEAIYNNIASAIGAGKSPDAFPQIIGQAIESGETAISQSVASSAAVTVLNAIAFVLVLVISKIVIFVASKILIKISNFSIIGFFNRIFGGLFGVLQGIIIVYIALTVIYAVAPIRENPVISKQIESSYLAKVMYGEKPITQMIEDKGGVDDGQSTT